MRASTLLQSLAAGFRGFASHAGRAGEASAHVLLKDRCMSSLRCDLTQVVGSIDAKHGIKGVINVPQRILMGPGASSISIRCQHISDRPSTLLPLTTPQAPPTHIPASWQRNRCRCWATCTRPSW